MNSVLKERINVDINKGNSIESSAILNELDSVTIIIIFHVVFTVVVCA